MVATVATTEFILKAAYGMVAEITHIVFHAEIKNILTAIGMTYNLHVSQ